MANDSSSLRQDMSPLQKWLKAAVSRVEWCAENKTNLAALNMKYNATRDKRETTSSSSDTYTEDANAFPCTCRELQVQPVREAPAVWCVRVCVCVRVCGVCVCVNGIQEQRNAHTSVQAVHHITSFSEAKATRNILTS